MEIQFFHEFIYEKLCWSFKHPLPLGTTCEWLLESRHGVGRAPRCTWNLHCAGYFTTASVCPLYQSLPGSCVLIQQPGNWDPDPFSL